MSFADQVVKDGRGAVYKLDISLDSFSTIAHRYSTSAGIDASHDYDPRLVKIGRIAHELGIDRLIPSASSDLVIANDDGGANWMMAHSSTDIFKARCRLYLGLYDPANPTPTSIQWKQLGEFVFDEFPQRGEDNNITVTLQDDALGFLSQPVVTPTIRDLYKVTSPTTNPLGGYGRDFPQLAADNIDRTIPLAFGADWVQGIIPTKQLPNQHTFKGRLPVIICATTNSAAIVAQQDVAGLTAFFTHVNGFQDGRRVPEFYLDKKTGLVDTVYVVHKFSSVSAGGKTWYILWVEINVNNLLWFLQDQIAVTSGGGAYRASNDTQGEPSDSPEITEIWAAGFPLSARTNTASEKQTPSDILTDLVSYYSTADSSRLDTDSVGRVKANYPNATNAFGVINSGMKGEERSFRDHLSELADSFDIDIFMRQDGKVGMTAKNLDYTSQTQALLNVDETRLQGPVDYIPSRSQRNAPYNRVNLIGGPERTADFDYPPFGGPFDDPAGTVASWGRTLPRDISQKWLVRREQGQDPWGSRNIEAKLRPMIEFVTDLEILQLELGDYFTLTLKRNLGDTTTYDVAIFQLEGMTLDPSSGLVSVKAVWSDDLRTNKPYILDDETLLTRVNSSGGRTATVTDSATTVTFAGGNLVSDGVLPGDHLILKDATQATTIFTRFRALKIASVTDATHLEVDSSDLDFDAPSGAAVVTWEIRRSYLTYPDAASDVAHYPLGGVMYGKVGDVATDGAFSDSVLANRLLDG